MLVSKRAITESRIESEPDESPAPEKIANKKVIAPQNNIEPGSLSEILRAQNRTTHAVRSLPVFLFAWLPFSFITGAMILLGYWIYVSFISSAAQVFGGVLIVLGAIFMIWGFFAALKAGNDELNKSNPN
jgi:hypothetical protein